MKSHNGRELTLDITRHEKDLDKLKGGLERLTLKRLRIVIDRPTDVLDHAKSVHAIEMFDKSVGDIANNERIIHSYVANVCLKLDEMATGSVLTNWRFPNVEKLEVATVHTYGGHADNTSNWVKCLTNSYCINELRLVCNTDAIFALPEHVTGSVSRVVFIPCEGFYHQMERVCATFPYLESMSLYTFAGAEPERAKLAARQARAVNPAVEVTYFDRYSDYFRAAVGPNACGCKKHLVQDNK